MALKLTLTSPPRADGEYRVTARGYMLASLYWADENGPLADWTAFAYLPLDVNGCASFRYSGGRAIPPEATHVAARLISPDFQRQEVLFAPIPKGFSPARFEADTIFAVMSDLHLSSKTSRIRHAFQQAAEADCVLLPGDLTNDAAPEQFNILWRLIEENLPDTPVLAVCGNHDFPVKPLPLIWQGIDHYGAFQEQLLNRAERLGLHCKVDESGAYCAVFRNTEIFGLNAVSHWRRFVFPEGRQLDWLRRQLSKSNGRRIALCHAPLIQHNPLRGEGDAPYLSRDAQLQQILDEAQHVMFLSGHTHISLNTADGCVEYNTAHGNLYLNDSSVTPTAPCEREVLADREWVDGAICFLSLCGASTEIKARCLTSGRWIARGYYRYAEAERYI